MPIYIFKCQVCGWRFEKLVKGPNAQVRCPKFTCRSRAVRRLPAVPQRPIIAKAPGETYKRLKAPKGYNPMTGEVD